MPVHCSWESCQGEPKCFKVQLGGRSDAFGTPVDECINLLELLTPSHKIQLSFAHCRRSIRKKVATAITIVQAYLKSMAAAELEVVFQVGNKKYDLAYQEFLSHKAAQQAITKVSFYNLYSSDDSEDTAAAVNLIAQLSMLENLRSLEFCHNPNHLFLVPLMMSPLSQVQLSNTFREVSLVIFGTCFWIMEETNNATCLVNFLRRNKQIHRLKITSTSNLNATQIIAAYLDEEVTMFSHFEWTIADYEQEMDEPYMCHSQLAQQKPSIFTGLNSIELTQGINLQLPMDEEAVDIVRQLAQNLNGNSRQLKFYDPCLQGDFEYDEPENYLDVLSNFLGAAVGSNSNLPEFVLEFWTWRLEPVAVALEAILPHLSTRLQKIKLCVVCSFEDMEIQDDSEDIFEDVELDDEKINAFKARIVAALGQNADLLALKSFDLELHSSYTSTPDVIDQNTKQQFSAFVSKKSIQRICAEDAAFQLAALPKALEQLQSNPHLDNQYSATMLFHCLRSNKEFQEEAALTQVPDPDTEDEAGAGRQMALEASQETIVGHIEDTASKTGEYAESTEKKNSKRKRDNGSDSTGTEEMQE